MKRSEMLALIKDTVYMNSGDDIVLTDDTCNALLSKLEEAGMQPPFVEHIWRAQSQTSNPVSGHEWEQE